MGDGSCNFPVQFVLNFHEGGGEGRVDTRYSTVKENQIEGVTSVEVIREPGGRPLVFAPQVQIPTQHAAGTAQAVHLPLHRPLAPDRSANSGRWGCSYAHDSVCSRSTERWLSVHRNLA